jgi:hypothetical protein
MSYNIHRKNINKTRLGLGLGFSFNCNLTYGKSSFFFVIVGNTSPKHDFHDYTHMTMLSNRIHLMPF